MAEIVPRSCTPCHTTAPKNNKKRELFRFPLSRVATLRRIDIANYDKWETLTIPFSQL
jgi:hypothetical protein